MKHILISIRPEHCYNILNKEKILELRKSIPNCDLPCIVHIYCTKGKDLWMHDKNTIILGDTNLTSYYLNGKIIAEFKLDKIDRYTAEFTKDCYEDIRVYTENEFAEFDDELYDEEIVTTNCDENPSDCDLCRKSCLSYEQIRNYIGFNFHSIPFYAWHIKELKIYDRPKELGDFIHPCPKGYNNWGNYACYKDYGKALSFCKYCKNGECDAYVKRPPQDWFYVEEL